ncbi:PRC-barrel domain-containing protein [Nanoarchaeota archaeon]
MLIAKRIAEKLLKLCAEIITFIYYNITGIIEEELQMLKMKRISETFDMRVFTDSGDYFGDVEEIILTHNKVFGWRVRATRDSFLSKVLGSAKGVIVPHQLVKAMGDIMIISKSAVPSYSEDDVE